MRKLTFKALAEKVLTEENKPLTAEEIWEIAKEKGYDKQCESQGKTPWRTLSAQIYVDIRDNPDSPFVKIESKPRKFFLKVLNSPDVEKKEASSVGKPKKVPYLEKDLHPFLAYFAKIYMGVYTKTIHHESSTKKKYAQWQHPDMVGVYFPIEEWAGDVVDFAKEISSTYITLYSFELKRELGFHNLRESFFQAVSNSSWANEGYLVSANLDESDDFLSELKRLSAAFGIGIIKLNIEDPDSSEIVFSAIQKRDLDWNTINELAKKNAGFNKFLKRVKIDLSSKEIRKEWYEGVLDRDDLIRSIKK